MAAQSGEAFQLAAVPGGDRGHLVGAGGGDAAAVRAQGDAFERVLKDADRPNVLSALEIEDEDFIPSSPLNNPT